MADLKLSFAMTAYDRMLPLIDGEVKPDGIELEYQGMPGAVPRTSTFALNNATMRYTRALADKDLKSAVEEDPGLREGVNTYAGHITCRPVAESLGRPYRDLGELLES